MDRETRRYWLNTYRQRARMARADLRHLDIPLNDPLAAAVARRLHAVLAMYEAAIDELQRAKDQAP
jgi:hypothetical protein